MPRNLRPSLATAATDYAAPYRDGCHVPLDGRRPTWSCVYAASSSKTTIVLFGDSHALAWFPAVRRLAADEGWRLVSLTMSACSPADIPEWIAATSSVSDACGDWRRWALARIEREKPLVTLVAGTRGFATVDASGRVASGAERTSIWEAGVRRTLQRLSAASGRVIWLSDTPASAVDPPACLARHRSSVLACATPVARAVNWAWHVEEQRVAEAAGIGFVDTTAWVCPTSPCPVTLANLLVYRDGGHMTATFAASLAPRLHAAVAADLARRPPRGAKP